jgi:diacylglycerol kinase family enzyme
LLLNANELVRVDIGKISKAAQSRHIHIWSAGGDGTVMSVFELLVSNRINLDLIFFSCKL